MVPSRGMSVSSMGWVFTLKRCAPKRMAPSAKRSVLSREGTLRVLPRGLQARGDLVGADGVAHAPELLLELLHLLDAGSEAK